MIPDASSDESAPLALAGNLADYKFYHENSVQTRIVGADGVEQIATVASISFDHEFVRLTEIQFENE